MQPSINRLVALPTLTLIQHERIFFLILSWEFCSQAAITCETLMILYYLSMNKMCKPNQRGNSDEVKMGPLSLTSPLHSSMKLECKDNNAFLLVTFSVFNKNNCGLRLSLQYKHLGNSGIIKLWEAVPLFCWLLFFVFQTAEWQPHPGLILNTFFWLPPP